MRLTNLFYSLCFVVVTFIHDLYLTLCDVADRLKPMLKQAVSAVELGASYADNLLLKSTGKEFSRQKKLLPRHLACVFVDQNVNIDKIVTIVKWCSAIGIRCISLYDHEGVISQNHEVILTKLKNTDRCDGSPDETYLVHQGFTKNSAPVQDLNTFNVYLLSRLDGRPMFAKVANEVALENEYQAIDVKIVGDTMKRYYPHEPELLLQFGSCHSNVTWGYPPWLLRWTQMLCVPSHTRVRADHIASALKVFGCCEQRYGK